MEKSTTSKKRKKSQALTLSPYVNYTKNPINKVDKENQLKPPTDAYIFPNLYYELRFSAYRKTGLNIEKKLALPDDLKEPIEARIQGLGLAFIDRDLGRINTSWVKEFYCNIFRETLDSVHLWGGQISILEADIESVLQCLPRTSDFCAYQEAETAINTMTFDYEALKSVIATPDTSWVMESTNTRPKGMLFTYLTKEARTWQQIFAHYIRPTTHFSEILMDMLILIGCVMEGKEVYFPRLIRRSMWRAHIRGLLPFPTMITRMVELAGTPWRDDDAIPPAPDEDEKEVTIPWGGWVHEKPLSKRPSRARAVVEAARPSFSTAAAGPSYSTAPAAIPPPAPQPTYLLVQRLFRFMERSQRQIMRRLDRIDQMFVTQGLELPPLPESSGSDKETYEEENADLHDEDTHEEKPIHVEAPSQTQLLRRHLSHSPSQS
ncbi:hypothetical protein Ahy_B10g103567 isoform B [Arachis hypogaea]|uniref:Putative plant transposon protein domain-containing protein n=1 Tax=Arachis hypogaea TaxID=3818 RepID=A0A444X3P4_ARAHY|nr:hypothetical protein Ahy_B10g103567 isoform B [Arachis hypogaea]